MAEYVSQSIEESLQELEQMERVGLFTKKEIRQILKKRTVFEYKLRRKTKVKDDYLQYIQYQTNLLALVKKRRKRIGYNFKKFEIDIAIEQRIHRLFTLALHRFPEDVKLWMTHIAFCKQSKENHHVSRQFTKMLQVHDKKTDLWLAAAKWEFEDNNNSDNARSLLQRALRFNGHSKSLWIEYYRMELLFAEKMRKRAEMLGETNVKEDDVQDGVLTGKVALVVYQQAIQTLPDDVQFLLSFLPICQLFDFTHEHEEDMYKRLKEQYSNQPVTWDALAQRSLARDAENGEMLFHQMYEEAVNTVPSQEIWSLYLQACLQLVHKVNNQTQKNQRTQRALLVFEEAKEAGYLSCELWGKWIELLCDTGSPDQALVVSETGTQTHPTMMSLWKQRLTVQITTNVTLEEILKTLKDAQNSVQEKESWPLIQLVLDFSVSVGAADNTVRLLERSMIGCPDVSGPAKEVYLELEYLKHGIEHARKIYARVSQYRPVSVKFYKSYINMEEAQGKCKAKFIRKAYEDAVREHGQNNPDLWLDFIKMETSHPNGKPENVGKIHHRAVKNLVGKANQEFIQKYTIIQTT